MGLIFSWFRKPSTKQQLQDIQEELDSIEDRRRDVENRTRCLGRYVVYSFVLYLLVGLCTYWYWLPRSLQDWLGFATPFAAFPPLVMMVKRLLHWYYGRQLRHSRGQLEKLKQRKRDILDQVMETETYKVATEILQEYAPEQLTPMVKLGPVTPRPGTVPATGERGACSMSMSALQPLGPQQARHGIVRLRTGPTGGGAGGGTPAVTAVRPLLPTPVRPLAPTSSLSGARLAAPLHTPHLLQGVGGVRAPPPPSVGGRPPLFTPLRPAGIAALAAAPAGSDAPGVPLPRPVAPRERGFVDRLIDYLMGEGPDNSYALVCRNCETHNGMALKDDFPYMAYRCAYCHYWNPARKQRPAPPLLESLQKPPPPPPVVSDSSSGEEEAESTEESAASDSEEVDDDKKKKSGDEGNMKKKENEGDEEEPMEKTTADTSEAAPCAPDPPSATSSPRVTA